MVAAFALLPLAASAAPTSFHLVFDGHHVAGQCPPACSAEGLVHVGTFTTNDALCPSGHAEDIEQNYIHMDIIATRLFTCDGSRATFTATVFPLAAEHGFAGSNNGVWQSTWMGTVDMDATPPTLMLTKHAAAKLTRPKGSYKVSLALALSDNDGGSVSYTLTLTDPTTQTILIHKSANTTAASLSVVFVLKPSVGTRALRLEVDASDLVGNQATLKHAIALKK